MVKIINNAVCRGVAGKMVSIKGVVIHNTYDNHSAEWHMNRLANMTTRQLEAGYAHYFVDENTIVRTENTYNAAWHTANYEGNYNYIGYEVKGDNNTNTKEFLQAEQNTFWQAAIDLRFYKLPVNRNTVRLHHEFSATECPKRSLIQHCGYNSRYAVPQSVTNQLKDYFIKEIKKYYENPNLKPDSKNQEVKPVVKKKNDRPKHYVVTGWYTKGSGAYKQVEKFLKDNKMGYKLIPHKSGKNRYYFQVGWFWQNGSTKVKLEKFLGDNNYHHVVVTADLLNCIYK